MPLLQRLFVHGDFKRAVASLGVDLFRKRPVPAEPGRHRHHDGLNRVLVVGLLQGPVAVAVLPPGLLMPHAAAVGVLGRGLEQSHAVGLGEPQGLLPAHLAGPRLAQIPLAPHQEPGEERRAHRGTVLY